MSASQNVSFLLTKNMPPPFDTSICSFCPFWRGDRLLLLDLAAPPERLPDPCLAERLFLLLCRSVPGSPKTMVLILRAKLVMLESFLPSSTLVSSWLRNCLTSSEASIPRTISAEAVCCNIDDFANELNLSQCSFKPIDLFSVKVYPFPNKVQTRISLLLKI